MAALGGGSEGVTGLYGRALLRAVENGPERLGRGRKWAVFIVQSVRHAIIQESSLLLLPRLLGSRSQLALRAELPMRICHVFLLPGRSGPVLVTAMSLLLCSALLCSDI